MITLVSVPGIFRDLLEEALATKGYTLRAVVDTIDEVFEVSPGECLLVYIDDIDAALIHSFSRFRERYPDNPIELICTKEVEPRAATNLGVFVNALMPVDRPLDIVIGSLAVIAEGYFVFDAKLRAQAENTDQLPNPKVQTAENPHPSLDNTGLSKREITVLQRIENGHSNKEIARDLDISDSTVKVHVRAILQKTGTKNRTQAAIWASQHL